MYQILGQKRNQNLASPRRGAIADVPPIAAFDQTLSDRKTRLPFEIRHQQSYEGGLERHVAGNAQIVAVDVGRVRQTKGFGSVDQRLEDRARRYARADPIGDSRSVVERTPRVQSSTPPGFTILRA